MKFTNESCRISYRINRQRAVNFLDDVQRVLPLLQLEAYRYLGRATPDIAAIQSRLEQFLDTLLPPLAGSDDFKRSIPGYSGEDNSRSTEQELANLIWHTSSRERYSGPAEHLLRQDVGHVNIILPVRVDKEIKIAQVNGNGGYGIPSGQYAVEVYNLSPSGMSRKAWKKFLSTYGQPDIDSAKGMQDELINLALD